MPYYEVSLAHVRKSGRCKSHVNQSGRKVLALVGQLLELFDQSMRDVRRRLNDGMSAGAQGRVDFGSLVDDVLNDGLGLLEQRRDSLRTRSALPVGMMTGKGSRGSRHRRRPWTA